MSISEYNHRELNYEIEELLNVSQSNVSRHLNKLTNWKIINHYKAAQYVYYPINEDTIREYPFIKEIIENDSAKIKQCCSDFVKLRYIKIVGKAVGI